MVIFVQCDVIIFGEDYQSKLYTTFTIHTIEIVHYIDYAMHYSFHHASIVIFIQCKLQSRYNIYMLSVIVQK